MSKKIMFLYFSMFMFTCFGTAFAACPQAAPLNSSGFCSSFKSVAQCHCAASGLPRGMCLNMKTIYDRMISMFGTVRRACEYQHDTSVQNCIDTWSCYRAGGYTSANELCGGTGRACE